MATHPPGNLKSLRAVWPGGPKDLLADLLAAGFESPAATESPLNVPTTEIWSALHIPSSSDDQAPAPYKFCYVAADGRLSQPSLWGFVLVDTTFDLTQVDAAQLRGIRVTHADAAMDFILRKLAHPEWTGESHAAPPGVRVEHSVTIGPDCAIGEGTVLESGVRLGARVQIGKNCRIGAHTRIADDCVLGENCTVTGLTSIGGQGFGFVRYPNEKRRRPRLHVGRVVIADNVRIGAQVAIDRGVFADTIVGAGSAFDNIVQVAHNCRVGEDGIFCSFVGLSGSTTVGDSVTIAGMVGTKGHVHIGNRVTVAAQTGVSRDIKDGQTVKGYPPKPLNEALEIQAIIGKLPDLFQRLKDVEKLVTALEANGFNTADNPIDRSIDRKNRALKNKV